jgi:hypothetical protein
MQLKIQSHISEKGVLSEVQLSETHLYIYIYIIIYVYLILILHSSPPPQPHMHGGKEQGDGVGACVVGSDGVGHWGRGMIEYHDI